MRREVLIGHVDDFPVEDRSVDGGEVGASVDIPHPEAKWGTDADTGITFIRSAIYDDGVSHG